MKNSTVFRCLVVAGVAAAVYFNSLFGELVFDDHEAIENNLDVRTMTPLSRVFSNDFWGLPLSDRESHKSYRPLTTLSFRGNHILHGLWPPGFHAINICLHSLVSLLLYLLCSNITLSPTLSLTASLLFAVHPIHTEAVANIVGRTELLSAVFYLLSLLSYHHCLSSYATLTFTTPVRKFSYVWMGVAVLCACISMLCKEQGVTVLGVCLVYDVMVVNGVSLRTGLSLCNRFIKRSPPPPTWFKSLTQRALILLSSTLAILAIRIYLNGGEPPKFIESDNPASFSPHFLTRLLTFSYLGAVHLWLMVCPSRLCFDWSMDSIPLVESWSDWRNIYSAGGLMFFSLLLGYSTGFSRNNKRTNTEFPSPNLQENANNSNSNNVIAITHPGDSPILTMSSSIPHSKKSSSLANITSTSITTTNSSRDRRLALLSLSLLFLPFLPASNLLFHVGFVLAERVLYLPSMGACLLIAMGIEHIKRRSVWLGGVFYGVLCLSLLVFSVKTVTRNTHWHDELILAQSAVAVNPTNAKVYMTIGNVYAQQGNRKCELFYREALRLRPHYTAAWTNLGLVLLNTDRAEEAEQCYRKALSIQHDHINANTNMAHLCRLQERWEESRYHYNVTLLRRPSNPITRYYLGYVMERSNDIIKAEEEYNHALQLQSNYWEAHLALARLLSTTASGQRLQYGFTKGKRLDKAVYHYQRTLKLQPKSLEARYELGRVYVWKGQYKAAERELMIAVQLSPNHAKSLLELGIVYEQLRHYKQAAKQFETALSIDPTLLVAKQKLEELNMSKRL